jgi:hypothetical protein
MNDNQTGKRRNLLIGLGLLLLVILVLGGAWVANARLRPTTDIVQGRESATPGPTATTTATPTVLAASVIAPSVTGMATLDPDLERAVEQAYLRYWERYSEALETLDTSGIREVATGEELARIQDEVDGLRQQGEAIRVDVSHKYVIFDIEPDEAKVFDEILNRSYSIDPVTLGPSQGPDVADLVKDTFFFKKDNGVWKVTKSVRQEG